MYPFLAKHFIFTIGEKLLGTHILRPLRELEKKQWWNQEKITEEQNEKLKRLISHAYENVPYYRRVFDDQKLKPKDIRSAEDLLKLPILTKDIIRREFPNGLTAKNYQKKDLILDYTSGSTGEPFAHYTDKEQYSWRLASMFRFWKWAGYEWGQRWVRISLWPHNKLSQKLYDRLARCIYVPFFDMDDARIGEIVRIIRKKRPLTFRGYTSATYLFAKYLRDNRINDIAFRAVITTGETLFPHYRELIEAQFKCKVYDTYGGEGIIIAGQCEKGNYHLDSNNTIVEFIRDNKPSHPGELGNIIVTDLNNYAMPFIRYRIEDVGRPSEKMCPCGRGLPLMQSIEGRDSDIIVTSEGKYLIVHFFTVLFEFMEGVNQFQVIQEKKDEIEIRIVKNKKFTDEDIQHIKDYIHEGAGEKLKVRFSFVNNIPVTRSGKRRFVISTIKPIK